MPGWMEGKLLRDPEVSLLCHDMNQSLVEAEIQSKASEKVLTPSVILTSLSCLWGWLLKLPGNTPLGS